MHACTYVCTVLMYIVRMYVHEGPVDSLCALFKYTYVRTCICRCTVYIYVYVHIRAYVYYSDNNMGVCFTYVQY